jgi:hypothetical protein
LIELVGNIGLRQPVIAHRVGRRPEQVGNLDAGQLGMFGANLVHDPPPVLAALCPMMKSVQPAGLIIRE